MTDKEQIEEMAKDLPFLTLEREVYISFDVKEKHAWTLSEEDNKQIAQELIEKGYHKTIWHKVADGDLPEYAGSYLIVCGDESLPEYDVDSYENFWNGKRWVNNEGRVIAWIELPTYEEK